MYDFEYVLAFLFLGDGSAEEAFNHAYHSISVLTTFEYFKV